eukprot:TRINITY_DN21497_c0_g1_i2.p1 TRINITY_DN21497_c0_g1~~TRINITY_DN21497_c0_g1_i2.p1  ORF type:complete len:394 (-),score=67.77 TRINITY_DN21497_c0_g1_i2:231-1235(-)
MRLLGDGFPNPKLLDLPFDRTDFSRFCLRADLVDSGHRRHGISLEVLASLFTKALAGDRCLSGRDAFTNLLRRIHLQLQEQAKDAAQAPNWFRSPLLMCLEFLRRAKTIDADREAQAQRAGGATPARSLIKGPVSLVPRRVDKPAVKYLFMLCDDSGDGNLDFDEFCTLLRKGNPSFKTKQLRVLFQLADKNADGLLEYDEFYDFIFDGKEGKEPEFCSAEKTEEFRQHQLSRSTTAVKRLDELGKISVVRKVYQAHYPNMNIHTFFKLCKQSGLVDEKFSEAQVKNVFKKAKMGDGPRLSLAQFEVAVGLVADRTGNSMEAILELLRGACAAS